MSLGTTGARSGSILVLVVLALSTAAAAPATQGALPAPPSGLPQTWIASLHLNGHVFHPGDRITATVHVNADKCYVDEPPCVRGAEWSGLSGKVISGCNPKVPLGTPTIHCTWVAAETDGWAVMGANFPNPTGTPAVSQDFYTVIGTDRHVLDGHVTYSQTGHPVPGAHLSVKGAVRYAATTNADGYYAAEVKKGPYTVVPEGGKRNVFHPSFTRVELTDRRTADFRLDDTALTVAYELPARFVDANGDGLIDYHYDAGFFNPSSWSVAVTIKARGQKTCDGGAAYTFTLDGQPVTATPGAKACEFTIPAPKQARYLLEVTGKAPDGEESYGKETVDVRDFFVIGLGDSVASGEGNPDVVKLDAPTWEDARCDRSAKSFEAQAAKSLEDADRHTSVSFLHLACSGAGIAAGEVAPYFGIVPGSATQPLAPQVDAALAAAGGRKPDAVLISIGANDVGFGTIIEFCLQQEHCYTQHYPTPTATDDPVFANWVTANLTTLRNRYGVLAAALAKLVPADRVYITEYFDPAHGADGTICDPLLKVTGVGEIAQDEAQWAYNQVVLRLSAEVRRAAGKYGWHAVGGITAGFRTHGYCASPVDNLASGSWIRQLSVSLIAQHDQNGTMHPNLFGHQFIASKVYALLHPDLYPGGKPRPVDR